jgi:hypothetical protein
VVVHKLRHGLKGSGSRILGLQCQGLSNKKRDDGRTGVHKCPKMRDVIYGRPLIMSKATDKSFK